MGELTRKGEHRPIVEEDLALEERSRSMQGELRVPVLQRADNAPALRFDRPAITAHARTSAHSGSATRRPTGVPMTGKPLCTLTLATGMALAACANSSPHAKEAAMPSASGTSQVNLMPVKEWPLRFDSHKFSVFTYDTYGARVTYDGPQINEDPDELQRSSASYGPDYQRSWTGIHGMIRNFPAPAKVSWRSKDGQAHEAEIDIGEIFADEIIRHNVSRDEIADLPDGEFQGEPSIILEVNDRTIRVWMRAHISTKELQKPGNRYSDFRNDLVLVKTWRY